jgi:thioredoxin reductase
MGEGAERFRPEQPPFDLVVVGAGNSAGQAAVHLTKYASRVTLLAHGRDRYAVGP